MNLKITLIISGVPYTIHAKSSVVNLSLSGSKTVYKNSLVYQKLQKNH